MVRMLKSHFSESTINPEVEAYIDILTHLGNLYTKVLEGRGYSTRFSKYY